MVPILLAPTLSPMAASLTLITEETDSIALTILLLLTLLPCMVVAFNSLTTLTTGEIMAVEVSFGNSFLHVPAGIHISFHSLYSNKMVLKFIRFALSSAFFSRGSRLQRAGPLELDIAQHNNEKSRFGNH